MNDKTTDFKCLCLDTATDACSVAVTARGQVWAEHEVVPRQHTERLLPMVDTLLARAGLVGRALDVLAVGVGPGSFTGLRIATGVCQALAWAWELPVLRIPTPSILAQTAATQHSRAIVAMDARLQEVYWGLYQRDAQGLMQTVVEPALCAVAQLRLPAEMVSGTTRHVWHGLGDGFRRYGALLRHRFDDMLASVDPDALPIARAMLPLAEAQWRAGAGLCHRPEEVQPEYLCPQPIPLPDRQRAPRVGPLGSAGTIPTRKKV